MNCDGGSSGGGGAASSRSKQPPYASCKQSSYNANYTIPIHNNNPCNKNQAAKVTKAKAKVRSAKPKQLEK